MLIEELDKPIFQGLEGMCRARVSHWSLCAVVDIISRYLLPLLIFSLELSKVMTMSHYPCFSLFVPLYYKSVI
jgi:hypothetical protein